MSYNEKNTEYDIAQNDIEKALAAISLSRRKATVENSWEWARVAANHAASLGIRNASTLLGTSAWPCLDELEQNVLAKHTETILIVTRHAGFVEWLEQRGISGRVVDRATPADVMGKHVVGNLPWQLAAIAASFSRIAIPGCPPERRQDELTASELDQYGAFLRTYKVQEIQALK
jgi:putative CRISPR-associated protein (TIGR02620 family)